MKLLTDLVEISRFYGKNTDYVIAGGGNTSFKNEQFLWVKGSGSNLSDITKEKFAVLNRSKLQQISTTVYSSSTNEREQQVKNDLLAACVSPERNIRPSVESSLHEIIRYCYVVHTHPTLVNALMCSNKAGENTRRLFDDHVLYVPYTDPGYTLFKKVEMELNTYRQKFNREPNIIFLQNHGVFVGANTINEIKSHYEKITSTLCKAIHSKTENTPLPIDDRWPQLQPDIVQLFSAEGPKTVAIRHNSLIQRFYTQAETFAKVALPFTPDNIVYCKPRPLYIENTSNNPSLLKELQVQLNAYKNRYGYQPKIVVLKDFGMIAIEDNALSAEMILTVFEDLMKISYLSENFGGPHFLSDPAIAFIDNWEVEAYRRKASIKTS